MLVHNNRTYAISEEIQYKKNAGENNHIGYTIYWDKQTCQLNGLAAILFERLIRFDSFGLFDDADILIKNMDGSFSNKHMINMIFLNFLSSKWMKENSQTKSTELEISNFTYCTTVRGKHYLINFLYNTIDLVSPPVYERMTKKELHGIEPEELFYLYARRHIKNKVQIENECFAVNTKNSSLVYLILSYACNLKCTYCFEMGKNRKLQMDETTLINAVSYIKQLSNSGRVVLTFYGGEPLLEANTVQLRKVIDDFIDNKNLSYRFITNGINVHRFLDLFELIKDRIDKFVITVDGIKKVHDTRRLFEDSRGSFDSIVENICLLSNLGYPVSIRINLDKNNCSVQEDLLCFLNKTITIKDNVSIEYHRVEDKSNLDFIPVSYLDCYKIYQKARRISDFKVKFSVPLLIALDNIVENKKGFTDLCNSCCSMNRNHVIDLNGAVYCCNEAMGIDDFLISDVKDEPASLAKPKEQNDCNCPFFFACYCNCSLKKYYNSLDNGRKKCELTQIEELIQFFLESYHDEVKI